MAEDDTKNAQEAEGQIAGQSSAERRIGRANLEFWREDAPRQGAGMKPLRMPGRPMLQISAEPSAWFLLAPLAPLAVSQFGRTQALCTS